MPTKRYVINSNCILLDGVFIEGEEEGSSTAVGGPPQYTKIIKKLTPIHEHSVYSKLDHTPNGPRPQTLGISPSQEDYVSMSSAVGGVTPPTQSDYIQMLPSSTGTTPLSERPESSYIIMRSFSQSSEGHPSSKGHHRSSGKGMWPQRKLSFDDSTFNKEGPTASSDYYIDILKSS